MNFISLKARAKINLSLDVLNKRLDGYHDIRMIMQTIALCDNIYIEIIDKGIEVMCENTSVPTDNSNIVYKVAMLMKEMYSIDQGVRIKIDKNIPIAAGLAGGSSDGAAVFKGMNKLFSLNLTEDQLAIIGKKIGADIPFCIKGGTMLSEGIGDILTDISSINKTCIVLAKPKIDVSTPWVYKNFKFENVIKRPNTELLIQSIEDNNIDMLAQNMVNVLETVTEVEYSIIKDIKQKMLDLGAIGSMMSGSGPTVFGIFRNEETAKIACESIKSDNIESFFSYTVNKEE